MTLTDEELDRLEDMYSGEQYTGSTIQRLVAEVRRLRLSWSKELPTGPGWYWYRGKDGAVPAEVVDEFDTLAVRLFGDGDVYLVNELGGEWKGPIFPE